MRGFTLIELVVVMVIVGILAYAGADLIVGPFKGFQEVESRVSLYEEGSLAIEKLRAELLLAVPNAVNSPDEHTLKFGMIDQDSMEANGVYGVYKRDGDPVDEYITDVNASAPKNSLLSIYNRRWKDFETGARIYEVVDKGPPMRLSKRVHPGAYLHKSRRYYIIRPKAVKYALLGDTIERSTAPVTTSGIGSFDASQPLVRHVKSLSFHYSPGNTVRNAVVSVHLVLGSDQGENVTLHSEVHIPNVP